MIPHGSLLDGFAGYNFVGADISTVEFAKDIFSCAASKGDLHNASNRRVDMHSSVHMAALPEERRRSLSFRWCRSTSTPKASRGAPGNLGITEGLHQPSSKRRLKGIEFEIRLGKIVRKGVPELQSST
jgi:hypothetical protein